MKHEDFSMKEHGFVGHLAEPDAKCKVKPECGWLITTLTRMS